jgi:peptidoglycan/xylan/chitin deacetylase (PgdA/CDA1 family)
MTHHPSKPSHPGHSAGDAVGFTSQKPRTKRAAIARGRVMVAVRTVRGLAVTGLARAPGLEFGVDIIESIQRASHLSLPILMYHRIADAGEGPGLHPGLISCRPEDFESQMEYIARRHRPVSMEELLRIRTRHEALPRNAVMLTFDDGYRDFGLHAWPVLKRWGLPATLFVPTAYPDNPRAAFWWDHLYSAIVDTKSDHVDTAFGRLSLKSRRQRLLAYGMLRRQVLESDHQSATQLVTDITQRLGRPEGTNAVLSWSEIAEMVREGLTVAAHSRSHARLDRLKPRQLEGELVGSYDDLRRILGTAPPAFAYPGGHFDKSVINAARAAGFLVAYTTRRGVNDLGSANWMELKRINVGRRSTLSLLRAQMALGGLIHW